jgi:hypothetical protein
MELLVIIGWLIVLAGIVTFFYIFYKEGDGFKKRKDELRKIFSDSNFTYRNEKMAEMKMNNSVEERQDDESDIDYYILEEDYVISILTFLEENVGVLVLLKSLKKAIVWAAVIITIGVILINVG